MKWLLGAFLALLLVVGVCAVLVALDERRLGKVVPGMTQQQVLGLLGQPDNTAPGLVVDRFLNPECRRLAAKRVTYERVMRESLLVVYDPSGTVLCTRRAGVGAEF
jgi:hypothetical protein